MKIIGRKREQDVLTQCLKTKRPEFVVVYGRRRVGKTFLVREYFGNHFSFYSSGVTDEDMAGQLRAFSQDLKQYGDVSAGIPGDWYDAFSRLKVILQSPSVYREPIYNRIVVFLDEIPWMDTARSDFKSALEHFWNTWASSQEDIVLIVCGSATTWIIDNILSGEKGFHNRITRQIHMMPFDLKECEELLEHNDIMLPRDQIIESYMVFGGIPYYLSLFDTRFSLVQNIDELCFKEYGELHNEYHNLFYSLYRNPENHMAIVIALSGREAGMSRSEIAKAVDMTSGSGLTKKLVELEQCGFIKKYSNTSNKTRDVFYRLTDPFTLFYIRFVFKKKTLSWTNYHSSPSYHNWRGHAFEIVCLNHVAQIKSVLKIAGIETEEYAWRNDEAQIDMIIDRRDGVVNLCEIKYSDRPYEVSVDEYNKLQKRSVRFTEVTKTKKAIHITLISANGLKTNKYSTVFQNCISGEELFVGE